MEECPETKRIHLQFVLQFGSSRSLKALGETCGCFVEATKDFIKAVEYCRKVETRVEGPWTFGEEPTKGGRPKLAKEVINMTNDELLDLPMH